MAADISFRDNVNPLEYRHAERRSRHTFVKTRLVAMPEERI